MHVSEPSHECLKTELLELFDLLDSSQGLSLIQIAMFASTLTTLCSNPLLLSSANKADRCVTRLHGMARAFSEGPKILLFQFHFV